MIEEISKIWIHLNEDLPYTIPKNSDKRIEVNIVIYSINELNTLNTVIHKLRMERCGFFKEFPTICIHCSYLFAAVVIENLQQYDDTVPRIKINIIIDSHDISCYSFNEITQCFACVTQANMLCMFTFLNTTETALNDGLVALKTRFVDYLVNNAARNRVEVYIDLSPSLLKHCNINTLLDTINNYVSTPSWLSEVPTCGIIRMLYEKIMLCELKRKYGLEDTFLYQLLFSNLNIQGCYYNDGMTCKKCFAEFEQLDIDKCEILIRKASSELSKAADFDQTKILDADWDYIV